MSDRFTVDMLPAREGDCLWIEYGPETATRRILVDGGRSSAYDTLAARFAALPEAERTFELLVCTHVDADHIEGLLKLIEDPELKVSFKDVWFNGYAHLHRPVGTEIFGIRQGERLTDGIIDRKWTWNGAFENGSVVVPDGDAPPPVKTLEGGLGLTLLSPSWDKLEKLEATWKKECEKHGLIPDVAPVEPPPEGIERFGGLNVASVEDLAQGPFHADNSRANGSSIAFIATYKGRSVLLAGDAHADVMSASLDRLTGGDKIALDALKLSHHGSKGTTSLDFLSRLDCPVFLVSTDGSRHHHPDREAIARVVSAGATPVSLVGNYRCASLLEWDIPALRNHFSYDIRTPNSEENGTMRVDLL